MRDHTYTPFFIVSGYVNDKEDRTDELREELEGLNQTFSEIQGVYNGRAETSFIVFDSTNKQAIELGHKYNQESVLVRSIFNDCSLLYTDERLKEDKSEYLGVFKQVPKEVAEQKDAYSIINNEYYITEFEKRF